MKYIIIAAIVVIGLGAWFTYRTSPGADTSTVATSTLGITGIGTTTTTTTPVTPNSPNTFTAALNQKAQVGPLTITPLSVTEDSRCPIKVQCIQAGTVRIQATVVDAGKSSTQSLALGKPLAVSSGTVTMIAVAPEKTTVLSDTSAFRFTFEYKAATSTTTTAGCFVGGCSGEVCSDQPGAISSCIYRSEYACYKNATCERQSSGQCGWTQTSALAQCVANATSAQ